MHRLITLLLFLGISVGLAASVCAGTPVHFWSVSHGGTLGDYATASATDAAGNIYVIGYFYGTTDLGGGPLVSAGASDIFLAKYDKDGNHVWSKRFGSTLDDAGNDVLVDAGGLVTVTGHFSGTVDFGGGGLVSAGGTDIFLAQYDAAGTYVWIQRFGAAGYDDGFGLATDPSNNIFLCGLFNGTVDFGGGGLVSAGGNDAFLAKYNGHFSYMWAQRYGSTIDDQFLAVASDGTNVFVTGMFMGTVDFGGGPLVSAGDYDAIVAKYNAAGTHQWSQSYGSTMSDYGEGVRTDAAGNIVVVGEYGGPADFGGGVLPYGGAVDGWVAKYDGASGAHIWSRGFGGTGYDGAWKLDFDSSGNVFVGGWMSGTVDFGGGPLTSAGNEDACLAKYDASGNHLWSANWGSTNNDWTESVSVDSDDNVIFSAGYSLTVDFGGGGLTSVGGDDLALVKYAGNTAEPLITSIEDIGNDQGRQVKIRFDASGYDQAGAPETIVRYDAFRRDDAPPASAVTTDRSDPMGLSSQELLADGWTQVGSVNAYGDPSYGIDCPTIGDSTIASGQYYSTFYIRAATPTPTTYFQSDPDSGYSLDNLAPGVPANFVYNAGQLAWDQSSASDFKYFTVYGSNANDFGSATVVDYTTALSMDVTASPYSYYFVTATDFSGNEGGPANLNTATGAAGTPASYVLSVNNYPNPFNPATTVKYTVPEQGMVTVTIYDARGARVKTLVSGELDAGSYDATWNGRADNGVAVSSGVYFVRIDQNGAARSKKMVLLK